MRADGVLAPNASVPGPAAIYTDPVLGLIRDNTRTSHPVGRWGRTDLGDSLTDLSLLCAIRNN
jgi:hypothetical protein